jgi:hypothetical protein
MNILNIAKQKYSYCMWNKHDWIKRSRTISLNITAHVTVIITINTIVVCYIMIIMIIVIIIIHITDSSKPESIQRKSAVLWL